jgi:hypothetical protein
LLLVISLGLYYYIQAIALNAQGQLVVASIPFLEDLLRHSSGKRIMQQKKQKKLRSTENVFEILVRIFILYHGYL